MYQSIGERGAQSASFASSKRPAGSARISASPRSRRYTTHINYFRHLVSTHNTNMESRIEFSNEDSQQERERESAAVEKCRNIMACKRDDQYQGRKASSIPNQRLVEVFGIKNVSTDPGSGGFTKEATERMKGACKIDVNDKGD